MEKIKNLSLRKTIILYMVVNLLCTFFLFAVITQIAKSTQQNIWLKYIDIDEYSAALNKRDDNYDVVVPRVSNSDMSSSDSRISELCDFLETYSILLLSIAGSCIAMVLFYKNKLKSPFEELKKASQLIAENKLDFQITYVNNDEMGQLSRQFERMRHQLAQNNKMLWQMIENERALRSAMAHDIRSPLSVLQGYQEMLLEFTPSKDFSRDKIMEMLREGNLQIERINGFVEEMRNITRLDNRELKYTELKFSELLSRITSETAILSKEYSPHVNVLLLNSEIKNEVIRIDLELVMEVTENILSNALRYGNERVEIMISKEKENLAITVMDDGSGFTDTMENVTKLFYHSNPQDDLQHFGMGMYISRIFCEKHGGKLLVANQTQGGAVVKALFSLNK